MSRLRRSLLLVSFLVLGGCQSMSTIPTEPQVDVPRYMGKWYVIAHIPAFLERQAYNATETYALEPPNVVRTTFEFRQGGFDGPRKVYRPVGYVDPSAGGGLWGMQFLWPIRAEFRIVHVSPDYQTTIIGRSKRDYVWIMARTPVIDEATYADLVARVAAVGYDTALLRRVPQQAATAVTP